jgi:hypothetical protein
LRQLGGVSVMYQRSLDMVSSSEMAVHADVFFAYSRLSLEREVRNGSQISYSVVAGYLGDHRFPLLRVHAERVRAELRKNGAEHIMAFFDEDSADERWDIGHSLQRENYVFLLEKLLDDTTFGLVLKPKVSQTLRSRLGAVSDLLSEAIHTGRCFVFEGGPVHSKFPPAVAALASDVAVSGHLCAPTAGLESALAGVPTLLLDREGWRVSPLYDLGVGNVVFEVWDDLWKTYVDHRTRVHVPGFGDWSAILNRFDPFQDGRAAQRMAQYLEWMLEGLRQGLSRDHVLADAAERYADVWGQDKIQTVPMLENAKT